MVALVAVGLSRRWFSCIAPPGGMHDTRVELLAGSGMKPGRGFIAELRRRNVIRMAGLYLVGAWLVTQVAGTVLPMFGAPEWIARSVVLLLAIGFVPALVFAWIFELTPDGLKRDANVPAHESTAPQTARRMDRAIIVVLVLAVGYFGFDKFVLAPQRDAALVTSTRQQLRLDSAASLATAIDKSIAVLPLANESDNKDDRYFSDGLSEDLITTLSQFSGLKVISRDSSFRFRDLKADSAVIGRRLGVAHLLEGSVRRAGDTLRISIALVNAADGRTLWAQRYDRPYKDIFALQDEITHAVAAALSSRLLQNANPQVQGMRPSSGNLDAYDALLQGNYERELRTEQGARRSFQYYDRAIALDPRYAQAYAQRSIAGIDLASNYLISTTTPLIDAARSDANTAVALAPGLAIAHIALGRVLEWGDVNVPAAEVEYRKAVLLAPDASEPMRYLGFYLADLGRVDEAIALVRQSLRLDPLNARGHLNLGRLLWVAGQYDAAEQSIRQSVALQPGAARGHYRIALVEISRGDAEAALREARLEPPGATRNMAVALALQIGNDHAAADAALRDLQAHPGGYELVIAWIYALRKEPNAMFVWLDRAWAVRAAGMPQLLFDPFVLVYKDDPRFASLCRKIGLPVPGQKAA
jgi:TolB-like protein/Flp pilus assembly protein TadD